jgi:CDP-glucose 4,6-dehydratase
LHGYITLAERLLGNDSSRYATAYNFGPSEEDARPVEWVADRMVEAWGDGAAWFRDGDAGAHEAGYLKLDASRARAELGWAPKLGLGDALHWVVRWYRAHRAGEDMAEFTTQQIREYEGLLQKG